MERLSQIMAAQKVPAFGVCAYDAFAGRLLTCRAASRLPKGAKSVIVAVFPYLFDDDRPRNLSRYACVPDYHRAAGDVLRMAAEELSQDGFAYEPFIDNSPIPEVLAAVSCGLGVKGDNGLLITPQYGSWVFIGCIVTDREYPATKPLPKTDCLHCGRCTAACPGGCLPGDDRKTCASALSQQKKPLTAEETAVFGKSGLVWGCDRCQEVCPLNATAIASPHPCFSWYHPWIVQSDLDDLTDKAYGWHGNFFRDRLEP